MKEIYHVSLDAINLCKELNKTNRCKIGIVTPYRAQLRMIREAIHHRLNSDAEVSDEQKSWMRKSMCIGTIDSFQGQEFEVVLISLVLGRVARNCEFVTHRNRIVTAITRPKLGYIMYGDQVLFERAPTRSSRDNLNKSIVCDFIEYATENGTCGKATCMRVSNEDYRNFRARVFPYLAQ